jgi:hypothetical protein
MLAGMRSLDSLRLLEMTWVRGMVGVTGEVEMVGMTGSAIGSFLLS